MIGVEEVGEDVHGALKWNVDAFDCRPFSDDVLRMIAQKCKETREQFEEKRPRVCLPGWFVIESHETEEDLDLR